MDAVPTGRGQEVVEPPPPTCCPNGHQLVPPNIRIAHQSPASCAPGGHRSFRCETCGAVIYRPPHDGSEFGQGSLYG